jgi:hypothetical protein
VTAIDSLTRAHDLVVNLGSADWDAIGAISARVGTLLQVPGR